MIVVAGLLIAFVLVVIFARRDMRGCRWRRVGPPDETGRTPYRCAACGARDLTKDGKAPLHCKRDQVT